ncbi:MAG: hypothetical protein O2782_21960 [bacterium]|nr:hypothetical protein [bacterium]
MSCALLLTGVGALQAAEYEGTVIDRKGAHHAVRKLEIRGSTSLEYYVSGRRQVLDLARIERFHIGGTPQDQEVPITVTFRSGRVEEGTIVIDGGGMADDDVAGGGSHVSDRLTGSTDLGPMFMPLSDVQEVMLQHDDDTPIIPDAVGGSIVDVQGKRFTVSNIQYRGADAFRFLQGRKKKRVALRHLSRLEFGDSPGGEMRPVTITYRTGKIVQGDVDASTVRLAGEVDHVYRTRSDSAFTGMSQSGRMYGIGLQSIKLVTFADLPEQKTTAAGSPEPEEAEPE